MYLSKAFHNSHHFKGDKKQVDIPKQINHQCVSLHL